MTTEVRNTILITGSDAPANPPDVRNLILITGSDLPATPPEIRNRALVVGYDAVGADTPPARQKHTFTAVTSQSLWSIASGSPSEGNLLLAFVGSGDTQTALFGGATDSPAQSDGWTELHSGTARSAGGDSSAFAYWKIAGASEPANYEFDMSTATSGVGHIIEISGYDEVTPINGSNYVATSAGQTQADVTGFSTTEDNCLLVAYAFTDEDSTGYEPYYTDPMVSGWTAVYGSSSVAYTQGGDSTYSGLAEKALEFAGPTGTVSSRIASQNDAIVSYVIAVAPGAGGAAPVGGGATGASQLRIGLPSLSLDG